MLRKLLNQASLDLTMTARGPLLVKSGLDGGADPSVPDMQFVRTNGQVYLPGSSLKGVFRSYAEKIVRTVGGRCCDPFDTSFCGKRLERQHDGPTIYRDSCSVCRLFGSTAMASRVRFQDAYPAGDVRTEVRTSVAIDRRKGSVAQGPFDLEVVSGATFRTEIQVRNFELWQLGLLALVLRDLRAGWIPLGFGKSRGLGQVDAEIGPLTVRYPGVLRMGSELRSADGAAPLAGGRLYGIGALATGDDCTAYGLDEADAVPVGGTAVDDLLGFTLVLDAEEREAAFAACIERRWVEVARGNRRDR